MMVVWNGAPALHLNDLSAGIIVGAIFGVMGVAVVITILFFYPFLYRRLVKEDWQLRWYIPSQLVLTNRYHLFLGPLIWKRGPVPWCPEEQRIVVQNYYRGHLTAEELAARDASLRLFREATELGEQMTAHSPKSVNTFPSPTSGPSTAVPSPISSTDTAVGRNSPVSTPATPTAEEPPRDKNFVNWVRYTAFLKIKEWLMHGVNQDIVHLQQRDSRQNRTRRLEKMHARAAHYDNQTEHLYSFLQVLTAATQSFAHGYHLPLHCPLTLAPTTSRTLLAH